MKNVYFITNLLLVLFHMYLWIKIKMLILYLNTIIIDNKLTDQVILLKYNNYSQQINESSNDQLH